MRSFILKMPVWSITTFEVPACLLADPRRDVQVAMPTAHMTVRVERFQSAVGAAPQRFSSRFYGPVRGAMGDEGANGVSLLSSPG